MVNLQRRVIDRETLGQHPLERPADRVTIRARRDEDVRGEDRVTGREFP